MYESKTGKGDLERIAYLRGLGARNIHETICSCTSAVGIADFKSL